MGLLGWAVVALVVSIIAGVLGFGGVARGAASVSKVLFGIFLLIAAALFIMAIIGVGIVA